jgi:hypothetical protein
LRQVIENARDARQDGAAFRIFGGGTGNGLPKGGGRRGYGDE